MIKNEKKTEQKNRQALSFSHTLGKSKTEIGAHYLKAINNDINIKAVFSIVSTENFSSLYENANVLVDATGDFSIRKALHEFARESNKPIIACA